MTRLDGWLTAGRDDLTLDLGPRIAERAQTPSPLSHQDADRDDLLQPKFYYLSAKQIKICNISKAVTVIFIFWRPPFLFSTRCQLTADPPCTTLIMIPSAPLFLTSFEIVLLIINFALFSYGHPDAKMSLYRLKSRGTLPSNAISHHRRSAQPLLILYSGCSVTFLLALLII